MQLVDMKTKPGSDMMAYPSEPSPYPYGLRICLNDEALDKLGIEKLPDLGAELMIQARVTVVRKSEETLPGDVNQNLDLQITGMAIGGMPKDAAKVAEKLYPEND